MASTVLLLHGFATSADRTWRDNGWIDLLSDSGWAVLAPDLLGHGTAPKPHEPEAYSGIEQAVLDALPDEPVHAIGFSLGARVLLVLASAHPERFGRIVVAGVGANLFRDDDPELIITAIENPDVDANPLTRYFSQLAQAPGVDPVALVACLRRPDRRPLTCEDLSRIAGPVLVVLGDRDFTGPPDPLVACLPGANLVPLAGTDHFATPKDFRFIDAALDFLDADR